MAYRINPGHLPYGPVGQKQKNIKNESPSNSFKEVFNNVIQDKSSIKISNHAQQRLQQRNIVLDEKDMKNLQNAIKNAEMKGAKESVLFYKDTAFVTSIQNKTIITAVDSKGTEESIFTNIDSAVIVDPRR